MNRYIVLKAPIYTIINYLSKQVERSWERAEKQSSREHTLNITNAIFNGIGEVASSVSSAVKAGIELNYETKANSLQRILKLCDDADWRADIMKLYSIHNERTPQLNEQLFEHLKLGPKADLRRVEAFIVTCILLSCELFRK